MTLIRINETGLTGISRNKNYWWEKANETPNEAFNRDPKYRQMAQQFYKNYKEQTGLKKPFRWVEVRILNQPKLIITGRKDWYEDPVWCESVFWVWQTPVVQEIDGRLYSYHVLEPLECFRVCDVRFSRHGVMPRNGIPAYVVPTECCDMAWNETSGGFSDHLRHRPDPVPTQEMIERKAIKDAAAEKLLKNSVDISQSPKWQRAMDQAAKRLGVKLVDE